MNTALWTFYFTCLVGVELFISTAFSLNTQFLELSPSLEKDLIGLWPLGYGEINDISDNKISAKCSDWLSYCEYWYYTYPLFNRSVTHMNYTYDVPLLMPADQTWSVWFILDEKDYVNSSSDDYILGRGEPDCGTNCSIWLGVNTSYYPFLQLSNTDGSPLRITANEALEYYTWYHVAWSVNPVTGYVALYVNGCLQYGVTMHFPAVNELQLMIAPTGVFWGTLSHLIVWSRQLTPAEIHDLYQRFRCNPNAGTHRTVESCDDAKNKICSCSYPKHINGSACITGNNCTVPLAPLNANTGTCHNPIFPYQCSFECEPGYRLVSGDLTQVCASDGNLSSQKSAAPSCQEIPCSPPTAGPDYGTLGNCITEIASGSNCTHTCLYGALVSGTLTRTCSKGILSPLNVQCPPACSNSTGPAYGGAGDCLSVANNSFCTQTCSRGLRSGSLQRNCIDVGSLTDSTAVCIPDCPNPLVTVNGTCEPCSPFGTPSASVKGEPFDQCTCSSGFSGDGFRCNATASANKDLVYQVALLLEGLSSYDSSTFKTLFVNDIATALGVSPSRIDISDIKIENGTNIYVTFNLLPPTSGDNKPSANVGQDLYNQVQDPNSKLYQGTVTKQINPNYFHFSLVEIAVNAFTQLSILQLCLIIVVLLLMILIIYLINRIYFPAAINLRLVTFLLSSTAYCCNIYYVYFLAWLINGDKVDVDLYWEYVTTCLALSVPSGLNLIWSLRLFIKEMGKNDSFDKWVRSHKLATCVVYVFTFVTTRNARIVSSEIFGFQCLSAPMREECDLKFALGGLISNILGDIPMIVSQICVSLALGTFRTGALIGFVFTTINLLLSIYARINNIQAYRKKKGEKLPTNNSRSETNPSTSEVIPSRLAALSVELQQL